MLYISDMAKKARHREEEQSPSKLDMMVEKYPTIQRSRKKKDAFDPRRDLGVSIAEYLDDYEPETVQKKFAEGKEKKAGRPRKDVRDRLSQYMTSESLRLASEMEDQTGTEFNFLRHLIAMPEQEGKKRRSRKLEKVVYTRTTQTPLVAGMVNIYEFRGRLKVMERLVQIVDQMQGWNLESEEYVILLWWWCKDAITRSHEEMGKISKKNLSTAFQNERRLYGMINQLERVRNRIRHVVVSAGMDIERIRSQRPAVGLVEIMKQKSNHS
jgi:hypothetical protein